MYKLNIVSHNGINEVDVNEQLIRKKIELRKAFAKAALDVGSQRCETIDRCQPACAQGMIKGL